VGRALGSHEAEGPIPARPPPARPEWDHELEAGAVWHRRLVDDVSAVGPSIGARDREPEAGAVRSAARLDTARESVEQARDKLALNALAAILNRETQMSVAPGSHYRHWRLAVPQRVRDEVREYPVERARPPCSSSWRETTARKCAARCAPARL